MELYPDAKVNGEIISDDSEVAEIGAKEYSYDMDTEELIEKDM